jgi:hypothetical protein
MQHVAPLLAHSLHAAVHWQPGGSLLTSIVDRETSVNASGWIIFLYHPLAEVEKAERLHLQGYLLFKMSLLQRSRNTTCTLHKLDFLKISKWLLNDS